MSGERILVVEDEEGMREFLRILLTKEGYDVTAFGEGAGAIERFKEENFHAVITDIKMPGMTGMEVLKSIKQIDPSVPVIIMTGHGSMETAVEAVNRDAFAYILKQARNDEIKQLVKKAVEMRLLQKENKLLKQQLKKNLADRPTIGKSQKIRQVFSLVDKVAETDSTILIFGESGTGKELIAREIHLKSGRAEGPFVSINCGALPESLLESELFGHVRGSFTGAVRDKDGLFAVAKAGTFFLDEVGETSPTIQVKLLRVLQEREIIPVGGTRPVKVDVRLIAATNADLERDVETGKFRPDLFYRLNVIPIRIPPLRERRDDIPLLVEHFLKAYCEGASRPIKTMSAEAVEILMQYEWPGNVRELENAIERAVILQDGRVITAEDLPEKIRSRHGQRSESVVSVSNLTLDELEREYLLKVLEETGWHKKRAASILGINASTLYRKLQRYGFEKAVATMRAPENLVGAAKSDD